MMLHDQLWRARTLRYSGGPLKRTSKMDVFLIDLRLSIAVKTDNIRPMPIIPPGISRCVAFFGLSVSITLNHSLARFWVGY